jgi:NMD protein affecting ribosome stability and mRNA decay
MQNRPWFMSVVRLTGCAVMLTISIGCASTPVVKPSCAISWEKSADYWRVTEYRLTVWRLNEQQTSDKTTQVVKAPSTQVSCQEAGANKSGHWQVTVQACSNDGKCSEASKPMSFQVSEK